MYELNLSKLSPPVSAEKGCRYGGRADSVDFKSKKIRVVLNQPVKSEQKAEVAEVLQAVDEDRKFIYQATIVRLMKSRKVS